MKFWIYLRIILIYRFLFDSLEIMKEDNIRLKKQMEEMEGERNQAILERNGLKQQCTAAIRQVSKKQCTADVRHVINKQCTTAISRAGDRILGPRNS